ncbi:right-handed parallel beta-helix repeat-containing protein [Streptomyces mirabilis]|uniref:right-handed parallel beta-helix repeat-containing protein n=1 Tax=Streptomyces mirabilis TaxID=68239 RepID=UPI00367D4E8B
MTAPGVWDPATFGAAGDYTTDDTDPIQQAIDTCSASGGGIVQLGRHMVDWPGLAPKSGVTLAGTPGYSKLGQLSNGPVIASTAACSDIGFVGFQIVGPIVQTVSVPTRARTASGPGATTGISLEGDLDPGSPGAPAITNVVIRDVTVVGTTSLPLRIAGVRGHVSVADSAFTNCQDVGFLWCESVEFSSNRVSGSADNGVSLSRGCQAVTCEDNRISCCAYNGIWISGFQTDQGPTHFTITGNQIRDVGHNGIYGDYAPRYGTITGNQIDCGLYRGPVDQPSDVNGAGIYLGGYPITNRTAPTAWATGIVLAANSIRQPARAGVYLNGVQHVTVASNLLLDVGTPYLADGTTAITATDATTNVGILLDQPQTSSGITVTGNTVADTRGTPYCNYGIVPSNTAAVTASLNTAIGTRQPNNFTETGPARTWQAPQTYNAHRTAAGTAAAVATGPQSAAATAGSNGALDGAGVVNTTAVATPAAGTIAKITYATPYATIPKVTISARNSATATAGIYLTAESTTGFSIATANAAAANASLSVAYSVDG